MFIFGNIGLANLFSGDAQHAEEAFVRQLRLCVGRAFRYGADEGLAGLAALSAEEDRFEQAALLLGAARAMGYPQVGDQPIDDRLEREYFAPARRRYGAAAWHQHQQHGAALSYDQAINYALNQQSTPPEPPSGVPDPAIVGRTN